MGIHTLGSLTRVSTPQYSLAFNVMLHFRLLNCKAAADLVTPQPLSKTRPLS